MKKHFLLIGAAALCMACMVSCQPTPKSEMAYQTPRCHAEQETN